MTANRIYTDTEIRVRFSEVDYLGVVWHGHYIRYFEDGREAFGKQFNLSYFDILEAGFVAPIVNINCNYKRPFGYGDKIILRTEYIDCDAAKLRFKYLLFKESEKEPAVEGESVQVFLDTDRNLVLTIPPFFEEWKKKWL